MKTRSKSTASRSSTPSSVMLCRHLHRTLPMALSQRFRLFVSIKSTAPYPAKLQSQRFEQCIAACVGEEVNPPSSVYIYRQKLHIAQHSCSPKEIGDEVPKCKPRYLIKSMSISNNTITTFSPRRANFRERT